jgi:hypothetical protein
LTENDTHKCLISYEFFPMTKILQELEQVERFEECNIILNTMNNYRERFKIVTDDIPTQYSKDFENEYYSYFKKLDDNLQLIARSNIEYYIADIKKRLLL